MSFSSGYMYINDIFVDMIDIVSIRFLYIRILFKLYRCLFFFLAFFTCLLSSFYIFQFSFEVEQGGRKGNNFHKRHLPDPFLLFLSRLVDTTKEQHFFFFATFL